MNTVVDRLSFYFSTWSNLLTNVTCSAFKVHIFLLNVFPETVDKVTIYQSAAVDAR